MKRIWLFAFLCLFLSGCQLQEAATEPPTEPVVTVQDEEVVDWIALQFPKLLKAFEQCGAI